MNNADRRRLYTDLEDAAQRIVDLQEQNPEDLNDHIALASDKLGEAIEHLGTAICYIEDKENS